MKKKTLSDTAFFIHRVAEHQGWKVNPDSEFVQTLTEGLTTNFNRYGYFLCPCRETGGSRERDTDVICPCRYSKEDIAEYGHCYCALFFSPEFFVSGRSFSSIPERRPEHLIP
ncbi:MAG TPA: ferredoxin-thioredoxin reductase catalytic domain-containing protein [Spirochaetales bacterium]|nr:ferredoxin-thioredoxin reductase catalytic domain-containing protein [Spirochaetales bacterium]